MQTPEKSALKGSDLMGMERPSPTGEKLQQILSKSGNLEGMTQPKGRDFSQGSIGSGFSSIGGNPNDRSSPAGGYAKVGSNYGGS